MSHPHQFSCQFAVRDSELDAQGIVNNAFYFVYMEHCRHQHLKSLGFDFYQLQQQGVDLILRDCCLRFKTSLKSGDFFSVSSTFDLKNAYRINISQDIVRNGDQQQIAHGEFTVTGIYRESGKLGLPKELIAILKLSGNQ